MGLLVGHHPRIPTDVLCPLGMPQEIRVVSLLPDEHEMRRRHELRHEGAPKSGAWKRVGANAPPTVVIAPVILVPQLLVDPDLIIDVNGADRQPCLLFAHDTRIGNDRGLERIGGSTLVGLAHDRGLMRIVGSTPVRLAQALSV
jgi:hypothetical protein